MCSMRGSAMSSAKRVWPVTLARPSTRRRGLPRTFMLHPAGGFLDGLEDLQVACAAAQVARDGFLYSFPGRSRLVLQQSFCGEQDARRAIAALRRAEVGERRLQRVQLRPGGEALDGLDRFPLALQGKQQAGKLRLAVDQNRAGAALAE